jgi:hypothetical protein
MTNEPPPMQFWTLEQIDLREPIEPHHPNQRNSMQIRLSIGKVSRTLVLGKGCVKWGRGNKLKSMNLQKFAGLLDDNI